jgi:hypothetical protein
MDISGKIEDAHTQAAQAKLDQTAHMRRSTRFNPKTGKPMVN